MGFRSVESATPLVSVVIPTYNRAATLRRAIDSALSQSYENLEVIVVDDGSTDRTVEVIEGYQDPRVRYVAHEQNRGGAVARNTGIEVATADYIAFLDSDDEWLPGKLGTQMHRFLNTASSVGAVYCAHAIREDGPSTLVEPAIELYTGQVYLSLLRGWCPASTSLFVVCRSYLVAAGMFDPRLPGFQDYDLWLRLSQLCHFDAVPERLVIKHSHRERQLSTDPAIRQEALQLFLAKWIDVIEQELGQEVARHVEQKYRFDVHLKGVLDLTEGGKRQAALRRALRCSDVTLPRRAALLLIAAGGKRAYEALLWGWQWNKERGGSSIKVIEKSGRGARRPDRASAGRYEG